MDERGLHAGLAVEYLDGDNDWPGAMKAVDEIGYQGWTIAEPAWQHKGVAPAVRLSQIAGKLDQILAL